MQPFIVGNVNTPVNRVQGTQVVGGNLLCTNVLTEASALLGLEMFATDLGKFSQVSFKRG